MHFNLPFLCSIFFLFYAQPRNIAEALSICFPNHFLFLQNIEGAKEDVMFSILLNPRSDECVPLLARIFAGKSKEELLCTLEAAQAQYKLHLFIKHIGNLISLKAKYKSSKDSETEDAPSKKSPLKSALGLEALELKVEKEEKKARRRTTSPQLSSQNLSSTAKTMSQLSPQDLFGTVKTLPQLFPRNISNARRHRAASLELEHVKSGSEKLESAKSGSGSGVRRRRRSELTKPLSRPMTSEAVLLGDSQEQGDRDQEVLNPRDWSVLSCPLPKIPSCSHGLLASIQDGFEETHFHKSIYYSKKQVSHS